NNRFGPDDANAAYYAKQLAALGDIYVNDAPSVSHRDQATTTGIVQSIREGAYIGLAMEKETDALSELQPDLVISGGAKVSDKAKVLKRIVERLPSGGKLLIGGAMA